MPEQPSVDAKVAAIEAEAMARVLDVPVLMALINDLLMGMVAGHCEGGPNTRSSRRAFCLRFAEALERLAVPIRRALDTTDAAQAGDPEAQANLQRAMLRVLDVERETRQ